MCTGEMTNGLIEERNESSSPRQLILHILCIYYIDIYILYLYIYI